jgi:uncharacterized protein (TIGR02391 family)
MDRDEKIRRLEEYKQMVRQRRRDPSLRSLINQDTPWVRQEVFAAGCHGTITIAPPPAIGGLVARNVDPFTMIFDAPYGFDVTGVVVDMVDQTIGVLRSGPPPVVPPTQAPAAAGLCLALGDMHPTVQRAAADLLRDGHYPEAVGRAAKALNQMVRQKTGRERDDGVGMMNTVFNVNPTGAARLHLTDLADQSKRDEQDGLRSLMAGVQAAVANVDKHAELGIDGPAHAMELLAMISFLARMVDRCQRVEP